MGGRGVRKSLVNMELMVKGAFQHFVRDASLCNMEGKHEKKSWRWKK
jgi:hypothetical protein